PLRLELAPGKVIDTFAYNGAVPGPVLRLREGKEVSIDIRNDTDIEDIVHWHGLYLPADADGAMEEGSPMVERGGTRRYTFAAKPRRVRAGQRVLVPAAQCQPDREREAGARRPSLQRGGARRESGAVTACGRRGVPGARRARRRNCRDEPPRRLDPGRYQRGTA